MSAAVHAVPAYLPTPKGRVVTHDVVYDLSTWDEAGRTVIEPAKTPAYGIGQARAFKKALMDAGKENVRIVPRAS